MHGQFHLFVYVFVCSLGLEEVTIKIVQWSFATA